MEDLYEALSLKEAVGVLPSPLKEFLPLEPARFAQFAASVKRSERAGQRIGQDWNPSQGTASSFLPTNADWPTHEDLKPWNDVCTKWCTNRYFPDAFSRINMIANVIRVYEALQKASGLPFHIVFKGGVMIRAMVLEFLETRPLPNRSAAVDFFLKHKTLSMSDLDFEIVQRNASPAAPSVHRLMTLQYAVLLWIQRRMERELAGKDPPVLLYLADPRSVAEQEADLRLRLQQSLSDLPEGHKLHGATVDRVCLSDGSDQTGMPSLPHRTQTGERMTRPRRNTVLFPVRGATSVLAAERYFKELDIPHVPAGSGGAQLYSTLNFYLGEDTVRSRKAHLKSVFHLSRIKHAFVVYYTTKDGKKRMDRIGGELLDLSQSHGIALDEMRRTLYRNVPSPYREYPFIGVDPRECTIRSYSLQGFLWDHISMIHRTDSEPWNVNKQQKRIVRYITFLVMVVLCRTQSAQPLKMACECTRSVPALENSERTRTGDAEVDQFLARERSVVSAALPGEKRKASQYLKTIHETLCQVTRLLSSTPPKEKRWMLDAVTLPALWFTNHMGTQK